MSKSKRIVSRVLLSGITLVLLASSAVGCAKDEIPPVIQEWKADRWVVEGEDANLKVDVYDNRKVETVYLQFGDGTIVPLTKTYSEKAEGENSTWETSLKLSPGEYAFSVVAKDKKNETKADGKISIYPNDADGDGLGYRDELKYGTDPNKKNPVVKYALDKGLGVYLPVLARLDEDGVMDKNEQGFVDLMTLHPEADQNVPEIYDELLKLPDLSMEKYSRIDEKDLEAVEDILVLADNPKYRAVIESMLNEGIRDERQYCALLEALLWIAYDRDFDSPVDNPLENYSVGKLLDAAWKDAATSKRYQSDKWEDFDEVANRLNSPVLVSTYMQINFRYDHQLWGKMLATGKLIYEYPRTVFEKRSGVCSGQAGFAFYCLLNSGYKFDNFDLFAGKKAACGLGANNPQTYQIGHVVCLFTENDVFYTIDSNFNNSIRGPFSTIEKAVDATLSGWSYYMFYHPSGVIAKFVKR